MRVTFFETYKKSFLLEKAPLESIVLTVETLKYHGRAHVKFIIYSDFQRCIKHADLAA
jgi:hypothetical protein